MKLLPLIKESNNILSFEPTDDYMDKLKTWLSMLNYNGRAPNGMKKAMQWLQFLDKQVNSYKLFHNSKIKSKDAMFLHNIKAVISKWNNNDILTIETKFKNNKTITLNLSLAIFHNKSTISENNFIKISKYINKHLETLNGFHKKTLKPKINIYFVKKALSKSAAVYKSDKDVIFIRPDKVISGDNYGSFLYVITHELGHRYEYKYTLPTIFDYRWNTTPYSKTSESWNGEQFAELFALSHWYNKYKEKYKIQLDKFNKIMK